MKSLTSSVLRNGALIMLAVAFSPFAGFATGAPIVCAPEVRKVSSTNDALFRDILYVPNGVGMTDEALYPTALNRQIVRIEVLTAYTGHNIGVERWTVAHSETDSSVYLVHLSPDDKGATSISVGKDVAIESERSKQKAVQVVPSKGAKAFSFSGVDYFRRWSRDNSQLFTPAGQEKLETYNDMFIVAVYQQVRDVDSLAQLANTVVSDYKRGTGLVLSAKTIAPTDQKPGECFVAVMIGENKSLEVQFSRYMMINGSGCLFAYQHRIYGKKASEEMNAWIEANGANKEHELLSWNPGGPSGPAGN